MGKFEGIKIMQEEHRTLSAVIHALAYLAQPEHLVSTDHRVLQAIIHYLDTYCEKLHHPAEDRYLFPVIMAKSSEGHELIRTLEIDHAKGGERIEALAKALDDVMQKKENAIPAFAEAVDKYAQFYWQHLTQEEKTIFPIAASVFDEHDWDSLVKGFKLNQDPIAGGPIVQSMDALLRKITEIAPAPIGLG